MVLILFFHITKECLPFLCRGYMAPEYAIRGLMSAKIDVFSFGVLMLEIISGRKNYEPQLDDERRELLNLVSVKVNATFSHLWLSPLLIN